MKNWRECGISNNSVQAWRRKGGVETEIAERVRAASGNRTRCSGVLSDWRVAVRLKGRAYRTVISEAEGEGV